jgi:hypothetical protein
MASLGRSPGAAPLTSADIPDNSITAAKIVDATIAAGDLAPNSVDSSELVDGSVDLSHMSAESVDSDQYVDASIDTAHIGDDQVTGDKLANDVAISTSGAITTTGAFTSIGIDDNADATAITIDSSERVGIGTTAPAQGLTVEGSGTVTRFGTTSAYFEMDGTNGILNYTGTSLRIQQTGADAIAINTSGNVGIGTTAPGHLLHIEQTATSGMGLLVTRNLASGSTDSPLVKIHQNHASDDQICFYVRQDCNQHAIKAFNPSNYNNTSNAFLHCGDNIASRCNIYWDGSLQNVNGTYGSGLSDERLKTNIEDVNSQWDDVKNINMVNFKLQTQGGENDFSRIGVIAQQVAGVSPNLVGERKPHPEDIRANSIFGTLYEEGDDIPKGKEIGEIKEVKENVLFFKDSIFFWKCAGALKEAMAKIETLETKVTALESA